MSIYHNSRAGTRGGKDQFSWNTVKSDKDRECYLGHSVMAPTGRWQEGKDLTWYAKDRDNEKQTKTAEFRAAKKVEEDALMAALGMKVMPPPAAPSTPSTQHKPVIKREPQSTSIKNEPMTPAIHNDSRHAKQHKHHNNQRKEDRRRRRQYKATGSDEEKHDWSENDEDDLINEEEEEEDDEDDDNKTKQSLEQNMMTEKDLDEFLIDLVKKYGLKTIQRTLKSRKEKKKRKHSSESSAASELEDDKTEIKHKHKKKHSHREKSDSKQRHSTQTSSSSSSSRNDRLKHH